MHPYSPHQGQGGYNPQQMRHPQQYPQQNFHSPQHHPGGYPYQHSQQHQTQVYGGHPGHPNAGPGPNPGTPTHSHQQSAARHPVWKPSAYESKQLDTWFYHIDEERSGVIKGAQAVGFLKKSNLHREILRKIWALVDTQNRGFIDKNQFYVIMRLVSICHSVPSMRDITMESYYSTIRADFPLPPMVEDDNKSLSESGSTSSLPELTTTSPSPNLAPSPALPKSQPEPHRDAPRHPQHYPPPAPHQQLPPPQAYAMTKEEFTKYSNLFTTYDKDGDGYLSGGEIFPVFMKSGVDSERLRVIWRLVDQHNQHRINAAQFAVAFHLILCISKRSLPLPPPGCLPPPLVAVLAQPVAHQQQPVPPGPQLSHSNSFSQLPPSVQSSTAPQRDAEEDFDEFQGAPSTQVPLEVNRSSSAPQSSASSAMDMMSDVTGGDDDFGFDDFQGPATSSSSSTSSSQVGLGNQVSGSNHSGGDMDFDDFQGSSSSSSAPQVGLGNQVSGSNQSGGDMDFDDFQGSSSSTASSQVGNQVAEGGDMDFDDFQGCSSTSFGGDQVGLDNTHQSIGDTASINSSSTLGTEATDNTPKKSSQQKRNKSITDMLSSVSSDPLNLKASKIYADPSEVTSTNETPQETSRSVSMQQSPALQPPVSTSANSDRMSAFDELAEMDLQASNEEWDDFADVTSAPVVEGNDQATSLEATGGNETTDTTADEFGDFGSATGNNDQTDEFGDFSSVGESHRDGLSASVSVEGADKGNDPFSELGPVSSGGNNAQIEDDFGDFGSVGGDSKTHDTLSASVGKTEDDFGDFGSATTGGGNVQVDDEFGDFNSVGGGDNKKTVDDFGGMGVGATDKREDDFGDFSSVGGDIKTQDDFSASAGKTEDDFGDFGSASGNNNKPDAFGDFGSVGGVDSKAEDDFGDFGSASGGNAQVNDDFGDFSSVGGDNKTHDDFSTSVGNKTEDDFGDFGSANENHANKTSDDFGDFSSVGGDNKIHGDVSTTASKTEGDFGDFGSVGENMTVDYSSPAAKTEDDFGDFGDFGSANENHANKTNDDFGDFSSGENKSHGDVSTTASKTEDDFGDFGSIGGGDHKTDEDFGDFGSANENKTKTTDDFGNFGSVGGSGHKTDEDFGDFGSASESGVKTSAEELGGSTGKDVQDDFGDFSAVENKSTDDFSTFTSSAVDSNETKVEDKSATSAASTTVQSSNVGQPQANEKPEQVQQDATLEFNLDDMDDPFADVGERFVSPDLEFSLLDMDMPLSPSTSQQTFDLNSFLSSPSQPSGEPTTATSTASTAQTSENTDDSLLLLDFPPMPTTSNFSTLPDPVNRNLSFEELDHLSSVLMDLHCYTEAYGALCQAQSVKRVKELSHQKMEAVENDDLELAIQLRDTINLERDESVTATREDEKVWLELASAGMDKIKSGGTAAEASSLDKLVTEVGKLDANCGKQAKMKYLALRPSLQDVDKVDYLKFHVNSTRCLQLAVAVRSSHKAYVKYWQQMLSKITTLLTDSIKSLEAFGSFSSAEQQNIVNQSGQEGGKFNAFVRGVMQVAEVGSWLAVSCHEAMVETASATRVLSLCEVAVRIASSFEKIPELVIPTVDLEEISSRSDRLLSRQNITYCHITLRPILKASSSAAMSAPPKTKSTKGRGGVSVSYKNNSYLKGAICLWVHDIKGDRPPTSKVSPFAV